MRGCRKTTLRRSLLGFPQSLGGVCNEGGAELKGQTCGKTCVPWPWLAK